MVGLSLFHPSDPSIVNVSFVNGLSFRQQQNRVHAEQALRSGIGGYLV
jgi:hypothetical protein